MGALDKWSWADCVLWRVLCLLEVALSMELLFCLLGIIASGNSFMKAQSKRLAPRAALLQARCGPCGTALQERPGGDPTLAAMGPSS
jgi:hypothetical protein